LKKINDFSQFTEFTMSATTAPAGVSAGPSFRLSAEQEEIRKLARDFSDREITQQVAEHHDRSNEFPYPIAKKAWEIGLMNCILPEEYGGIGLGAMEECLIAEELAHGCMGISLSIMVNNLAIVPTKIAGNDAQKKKYLGPLSESCHFAAYALTEPEVGSDPGALMTTAVKKGDKYILNGVKRWITGGGVAEWFVVFASTDPSKRHKEAPHMPLVGMDDFLGAGRGDLHGAHND
jgi:acyl-CoA dehydrogenase